MTPLRIHFFVNFVHPQGTYFRFHNLAVGLQKLGQKVTVFAHDHNRQSKRRVERRDGIEYHIVPNLPTARIFDSVCDPFTMARRLVLPLPPCDIAHLFQPFPCAAAVWGKARAKAKFYDWDDLWTHQTGPRPLRPLRQHWPRWITARLEQSLPRRADHVTAIDHFLAARARERGAKKVSLLYNPSPAYATPGQAAARAALGLAPEALYVGFMGFTLAELSWCCEALEKNRERFPRLRFALCGPEADALPPMSAEARERTDCLGRVSQEKARLFAAALDLALLPLEDNLLNQSRFPVKFSEYQMAGTPVLTSDIGECGLLAQKMPWVYPAGKTRADWLAAFAAAVELADQKRLTPVDVDRVADDFASETVCCRLLELYRMELHAKSH